MTYEEKIEMPDEETAHAEDTLKDVDINSGTAPAEPINSGTAPAEPAHDPTTPEDEGNVGDGTGEGNAGPASGSTKVG